MADQGGGVDGGGRTRAAALAVETAALTAKGGGVDGGADGVFEMTLEDNRLWRR